MGKVPNYPEEFRRRAVELHKASGRPLAQIAKELNVSETGLSNWVNRFEVDTGEQEGLTEGRSRRLFDSSWLGLRLLEAPAASTCKDQRTAVDRSKGRVVSLQVRCRFWSELAAAFATGALAVLTLLWHDWIELVTGIDPDHHNGSLEAVVVAVACGLTVALAMTARVEWRRRPGPAVSVGAAPR